LSGIPAHKKTVFRGETFSSQRVDGSGGERHRT
jgi:hypothetical protein